MYNPDIVNLFTEVKQHLEEKNLYNYIAKMSILKYIARSNNDTNFLQTLLLEEVAGLQYLAQYREALEVIKEAIQVIDNSEVRFALMYRKGIILTILESYLDASNTFEAITRGGPQDLCIAAYISLAKVNLLTYRKSGEYQHLQVAEDYCRKVAGYSELSEDVVATNLCNLGWVYFYRGDYENALETFIQANIPDQAQDSDTLNCIALTYLKLGDAEQARTFVETAEQLALQKDDYFQIAQSNFIRALIEEESTHDYSQAKEFYAVAFDAYRDAKCFDQAISMVHHSLRIDHTLMQEYLQALSKSLQTNFATNILPISGSDMAGIAPIISM